MASVRALAALVTVASGHDGVEGPDKLAAVNKVIGMLEDLQKQCVEEGTKEAKSYDTFGCYCKETTRDKADAIRMGEDEVDRLKAKTSKLAEKRTGLDKTIEEFEEAIEKTEEEMKEAKEKRQKELEVYERNEADLKGAVGALEGAIKAMKASKNPSLLQTGDLAEKLQAVVVMADALGWAGVKPKRVVALLEQHEAKVPSETYEFKSGDIISTLEGVLKDFKAQKTEVDEDESKLVADHKAFMKEKKKIVEDKTKEMNDARKQRSATIEKISDTSQELSASAATLLDDQEYMMTLSKMCSDKAQTWDQRNKVRSDELSALTAAIAIMKDKVKEKTSKATVRLAEQAVTVQLALDRAHSKDALEEAETEAETIEADEPASFLQRRATPRAVLKNATSKVANASGKHRLMLIAKHRPVATDAGRQAVIAVLRGEGSRMKSQMLTALASQIAADPLAKVKTLIKELIERLLAEAGSEANQKGFCDKAMSDAKQKRDYAAEEIKVLNSEMAELEARRDQLSADLEVLAAELSELGEKQAVATRMRDEEKAENKVTVEEAGAGLDAVKEAIDILDKFYKTAAKEEVKLELVQGPDDDAPDAGFDSGEAYTGSQGTAGGVLGMLDVIKSDFERTVTVTEKAEDSADSEYNDFMTESGKSVAEKKMAEKLKKGQKDDAEKSYEDATESLTLNTQKLQTSIEELLELKPTCVDTGMSFEERSERRQSEIESLKKALCIFENFKDGAEAGANC